MKKIKIQYLSILIPFLLLSGCSQQKEVVTTHISEAKISGSKDAIIYALPQTKLLITVETTQVIEKKGPFAKFASQYLDIENIILKNEEKWAITDIQIKAVQEVDPNQYYVSEGFTSGDTQMMKLSKVGLVLPFAGEKDVGEELPYCVTFEEYIRKENNIDFEDIPFLKNQIEQKTQEKKAEEAAKFIYRLRKRRFKLLASIEEQKAPAGEAFEINIRELNKLEQQYITLFIGKTISQKHYKCFEFIPDENNVQKPNVLFRFSSYQGILSDANLTGEPVYIQLLKTGKIKNLHQFLFSQTKEEVVYTGNIFYRIPEETEIRIFDNTKRLFTQKLLISQYGVISNLLVRFLELITP